MPSKSNNLVTVWRAVMLLCGYDYNSAYRHYGMAQFEELLWCHAMHEWVMHIHYQNWPRPTQNNATCVIKYTCQMAYTSFDLFTAPSTNNILKYKLSFVCAVTFSKKVLVIYLCQMSSNYAQGELILIIRYWKYPMQMWWEPTHGSPWHWWCR